VNTTRDWLICGHVALDICNVSRRATSEKLISSLYVCMAIKHIIVLSILHIISTDEDPGLRIESFAVINLCGVSTNKTIISEKLLPAPTGYVHK
jgi:hypothetical protein